MAGEEQARLLVERAEAWARVHEWTIEQLDCVIAVVFKILDGKCKMGEAEQQALLAVHALIKPGPSSLFGEESHALIAAARMNPASHAERIHAERLRAEAAIPKPVMKRFKALLRAGLAP